MFVFYFAPFYPSSLPLCAVRKKEHALDYFPLLTKVTPKVAVRDKNCKIWTLFQRTLPSELYVTDFVLS